MALDVVNHLGIMARRRSLIGLWGRQHWPGSIGPCTEQMYLQMFWQTGMTHNDYIEFLSGQSKVWGPLLTVCCKDPVKGRKVKIGVSSCPAHRRE